MSTKAPPALGRILRSSGHLYTFEKDGQAFGPFPGATAICGLQDSLGGSDGLMTWGINLALDEIERRMEQGATPNDSEWTAIRAAALEAKNVARNIGTAVHAAVDHINRRLPFFYADGGTAQYIAQYAAAIVKHGIVPEFSEKYVVNPTIGFGGTLDFYGLVDGERGLVDVKTGKEKPSQRLQLTGLSMGEYIGDEDDVHGMPLIDAAFILLLRPDSFELIRHEITDDDRAHFVRLVQTYHEIRGWSARFKEQHDPHTDTLRST